MIQINKLSVNFTGDYLFKDISFVAGDKDRIGLVGKNGAGKSTLLKIIHKELEPESGNIVITSGHKTGYLPQEMAEQPDKDGGDGYSDRGQKPRFQGYGPCGLPVSPESSIEHYEDKGNGADVSGELR